MSQKKATTATLANKKKGQEQTMKQQRAETDDYLLGEDYSDGMSDQEDNPNADYEGVSYSHNKEEKEKEKQAEEAEYGAKEADMKWDLAEFHFDETIDLSAGYVVEDNNGRIGLSDKGKISLSISNGTLQLGYRTNNGDFKLKEIPLDAKDGKSKKKLRSPINTDIVKSAYLIGFKMHGWDERVVLHMSTIPKFKEEGFLGDSLTVNKFIMPHEWKDTSAPIKIFDRPITNAQIDFQTKYPGYSPENLARSVVKARAGFCLVDLNSPLIKLINEEAAAHIEGGVYETPSVVETNQVTVPKALVKTYIDKTLRSMSYGISYGNVTNDKFQISLEPTMPSYLRSKHQEYLKSNSKTGRQYLGFADPCRFDQLPLGAKLNANLKSKEAIFKEEASRWIRVEGKLVLEYTSISAPNNTQNV